MIVLIVKFAFKKINKQLSDSVNDVKSKIDSLNQKKFELEENLKNFDKKIEDVQDISDRKKLDAENKATEIYNNSLNELEKETVKLKKSYENNVEKVLRNSEIELQQRISSIIIKNTQKKMSESITNRNIQNKLIDKSLELLDEYID